MEDCHAEPNHCLQDGLDCIIGLEAVFLKERGVILIACDFVVKEREVEEEELFDGDGIVVGETFLADKTVVDVIEDVSVEESCCRGCEALEFRR